MKKKPTQPSQKKQKPTTRMCIVSRAQHTPHQMLRLVLDPQSDQVMVDYRQKAPGRGVYLLATPETLAQALQKNHLSKAFRKNVQADLQILHVQIQKAAERQLLDLLSLGLRAGLLCAGTHRVEHRLRQEQALLLWFAHDAASSTSNKLSRWAQRLSIPTFRALSKEQIGSAVQLPHCSVLAITQKGFAQKVQHELTRFQNFTPPPHSPLSTKKVTHPPEAGKQEKTQQRTPSSKRS
ncbi:MAG: DUF448 domain-containing protein [Myxococcota bacterium]